MTTIRAISVAGALLALAAVEARQAGAEIYRPWCVQYFGNGRTSCAFDSFAWRRRAATGPIATRIPGTCNMAAAKRKAPTCRRQSPIRLLRLSAWPGKSLPRIRGRDRFSDKDGLQI